MGLSWGLLHKLKSPLLTLTVQGIQNAWLSYFGLYNVYFWTLKRSNERL